MEAVLVLLFLGYKDFLPFLCAQGLCGKVSNSEKYLGALGSQERPAPPMSHMPWQPTITASCSAEFCRPNRFHIELIKQIWI